MQNRLTTSRFKPPLFTLIYQILYDRNIKTRVKDELTQNGLFEAYDRADSAEVMSPCMKALNQLSSRISYRLRVIRVDSEKPIRP